MPKKNEKPSVVVSKRISADVVKELNKRGIDIGHEIQQYLSELAERTHCPTCQQPITVESRKSKKRE